MTETRQKLLQRFRNAISDLTDDATYMVKVFIINLMLARKGKPLTSYTIESK